MGVPFKDLFNQPMRAVAESFIVTFRHSHIVGSAKDRQGRGSRGMVDSAYPRLTEMGSHGSGEMAIR